MSVSEEARKQLTDKIYAILKRKRVPRPLNTSRVIENAIYEWAGKDNAKVKAYRNKILSVYQNLLNTKSLIDRLKKKEIAPEDIPKMSPQQLAPEVWAECIARREHEETLIETTQGAIITTVFECGKCGNDRCEIYELQTRGADEGTTTFLTCTNCGNKWKN